MFEVICNCAMTPPTMPTCRSQHLTTCPCFGFVEESAASPVPPLDLEGCVRLLERLADIAGARSAADRDYAEWHERTHPGVAMDYFAKATKYSAESTLLQRLAAFLSDELPGLRADLARERDAAEDLFEERGRLREALFLIVAECGDSDEWTSECDVVLRRAFLPLGHYRAARSVLPPDREPAKHGK